MKRVEVSFQECYRISLAIGNHPELGAMLTESLAAYRQELQATSAAVFKRVRGSGEKNSVGDWFSIIAAAGRQQSSRNIITAIEQKLQGATLQDFHKTLPTQGKAAGNTRYGLMVLSDFGYLILVWEDAEPAPELPVTLEPLNRKLAEAGRICTQRAFLSAQNNKLTEEILQYRQSESAAGSQVAQINLLYDVGRRLGRVLEPKALYGLIANTVHDTFDYMQVCILEVDAASRTMVFKAAAGEESQQASRAGLTLAVGQGMIGQAAKTGKTQLSGDVRTHPYYLRRADEPTCSELAVPVLSDDNVIAVLDIQSDRCDAFTETDILFVETLADQLAICIDNARLYSELQDELEHRTRANEIAQTMFRISNAVSTTFNLEELYRSIQRILGRVIDVTNFYIALYNCRQDSLTYPYIVDTVDRLDKFTVIENLCDPQNASHTAEVIRSGQPVLHTRADFAKILKQRGLKPRFTLSEIWLGVPLKIRGDIIGAVVVHSFTDPDLYTRKDVDLLVSVSDHIAFAIDRKRAEEENQKLIAELYQSRKTEAVGTLAGGMAHDFNNLLSVILGNIALAREDADDEVGAYLKEAEIASHKASGLTRQLITLSRGGAPVRKKGSLDGLIKTAARSVTPTGAIDCELNVRPDLWEVAFDSDQMERALGNIVENAVDFMPEGGSLQVGADNVELDTEVIETGLLLSRGRYVKIAFKDSGTGIAKEHLPLIFDPYFTTKEMGPQKGLGLGLAITHAIVRRHNGQISATSVRGQGTTVSLFLPAAMGSEEQTEPHAKPPVAPQTTGLPRVLVMDDEMMIRDLCTRILEKMGYETDTADNGETALRKFADGLNAEKCFGVAILDLTVKGGLGGRDIVNHMTNLDPSLKIIASSGFTDDPAMGNPAAFGFAGILAKPYTWETLKSLMDELFIKN